MASLALYGSIGMFLFVLGFWWIVNLYRRYFESRKNNGHPNFQFRSSSTFSPVESYCKLAFFVVALVSSLATAKPTLSHGGQHATYFALYAVGCLLEILRFHRWDVIKNLEYFPYLLGLLLHSTVLHLGGGSSSSGGGHGGGGHGGMAGMAGMGMAGDMVEMALDKAIVCLVFGIAVATAFELLDETNHTASLGKSFATLVLGMWFMFKAGIQNGHFFKVYSYKGHKQMQAVSLTLGFVLSIAYIFLVGACLMIGRRYNLAPGSLTIVNGKNGGGGVNNGVGSNGHHHVGNGHHYNGDKMYVTDTKIAL